MATDPTTLDPIRQDLQRWQGDTLPKPQAACTEKIGRFDRRIAG